jgi:hypothetical protein
VEHIGDSEESVKKQIEASLKHMVSYRTDHRWGEIQSHVVSIGCEDHPVCALVAALYQSEEWNGQGIGV